VSEQLTGVARRWTDLGDADPMWAALTNGSRGGRWDAGEFLRTGRMEIDAVLALLARRGVSPTMGTALDFGCGPGRLTAALAAAGFARAVGVDVSPTMLAKATEIVAGEAAERCEFVLNEGADLEAIPSDSVDFVYSCRVLQHMPPELALGYLREFLRVAGPSAIVAFQLPSEPAGGVAGTALKLAMKMLPGGVLDRMRKGMGMYGTSPAAVTRVVAEAGGVTVSIEEDASAGPRWRSHLYIVRAKG
jgi:SAM-dependent methyltransferase